MDVTDPESDALRRKGMELLLESGDYLTGRRKNGTQECAVDSSRSLMISTYLILLRIWSHALCVYAVTPRLAK